MAKKFWSLVLVLVSFILLPNYCFSFSNSDLPQNNLKIEEIKTRGFSISSTAAKWLEIANTGSNSINLADFCITSSKEKIDISKPNNCFPKSNLDPLKTVIVAYSGNAFLADNNLTLEEIRNEDNLLFELGGYGLIYADNLDITNLENSYKSSFLNISSGEIYLFNKNSGDIIDQISWDYDFESANSFNRPVYDGFFPFVLAPPSPFKILPEYISLDPLEIKTNSANFGIKRITDSNKIIAETVWLFKDNQLIEERDLSGEDNLNFKNLEQGSEYNLEIEACEQNNNICFDFTNEFKTKQIYPHLELSEIYPAPQKGEKEFVEIFNPNDYAIDLASFSLQDKSGHSCVFDKTIKALDYMAFYCGSKLSLNNDGDEVYLLDPDLGILDKVVYAKAKSGLSCIKYKNKWQWSRVKTPGSKNIFSAEYKEVNLMIAKKLKTGEKIKTKGRIFIAPNSFGKYFYLQDGKNAFKIVPSSKIYPKNQCLNVWGEIKGDKEKYLKLEGFKELKNCTSIYKIGFLNPDKDLNSYLGSLVLLKGQIYTQNSSYFVDILGQKVKLRANFKLKKGQGRIRGVLSMGTKYFQIFIADPKDFDVEVEEITSLENFLVQTLSGPKIAEAKQILPEVKGANYQSISDYRSNNSQNNIPLSFLWVYYLSLSIIFALAKILVLG